MGDPLIACGGFETILTVHPTRMRCCIDGFKPHTVPLSTRAVVVILGGPFTGRRVALKCIHIQSEDRTTQIPAPK